MEFGSIADVICS